MFVIPKPATLQRSYQGEDMELPGFGLLDELEYYHQERHCDVARIWVNKG
jgi:hypothetical protein